MRATTAGVSADSSMVGSDGEELRKLVIDDTGHNVQVVENYELGALHVRAEKVDASSERLLIA